jgi:hypothetical protein
VALGGHSIPLDRGALDVLAVLGIISPSEADTGKVSGLERAIPKNRGVEFASLLHQLAAEYAANPFSPNLRKLLLSINPEAKDRFPKRGAKKEPPQAEVKVAPKPAAPHAPAEHASKKKSEPEKPSAQKTEAGKPAAQAAHAEKSQKPSRGGTQPLPKPVRPGGAEPADKHRSTKEEPEHGKRDRDKSGSDKSDKDRGQQHDKLAGHVKHEKVVKSKPATADKSARTAKVPAVSLKRKSPTKQLAKRKPR